MIPLRFQSPRFSIKLGESGLPRDGLGLLWLADGAIGSGAVGTPAAPWEGMRMLEQSEVVDDAFDGRRWRAAMETGDVAECRLFW